MTKKERLAAALKKLAKNSPELAATRKAVSRNSAPYGRCKDCKQPLVELSCKDAALQAGFSCCPPPGSDGEIPKHYHAICPTDKRV